MDNDTIAKVRALVRWHDERPAQSRKAVRRAMVAMGPACFPDIFALKRADTLAQSDYRRQEKLAEIDAFERICGEIRQSGECVSKKDLRINGRDLMALGMPQGEKMGELLQELFVMVVDDPQKNNKEYLTRQALSYIKNQTGPDGGSQA